MKEIVMVFGTVGPSISMLRMRIFILTFMDKLRFTECLMVFVLLPELRVWILGLEPSAFEEYAKVSSAFLRAKYVSDLLQKLVLLE